MTTTHPAPLTWAQSVALTGPPGNRTVLVDVQMPGEDSPREMVMTVAAAAELRDMLAGAVEECVGDPGVSSLRVRGERARLTHEAVRTRLGVLLPVCGLHLDSAVEAPEGCEVTCPFCNGTETAIGEANQ